MTGKELLKQYNSLCSEIKEIEIEIKKLEKQEPKYEIDKVTGSNDKFPYEPRSFTIEGIVEDSNLKRKRKILVKRKNKCEDMKLQIEEFINTIPDSLTRRVFRYRYIDKLGWLQISRKLGKFEESYARKIHDRYLESLD